MNQGSTPNNNPYQGQQPGYQPPQQPGYQPPQPPQQPYQQPAYQRPVYQQPYQQIADKDGYTGDPKFKPLSPWAYVGYLLLYTLVPFGWIAAIIHATNEENINRRNFARGYWCMVLISVVLSIFALILFGGIFAALFQEISRNMVILPLLF